MPSSAGVFGVVGLEEEEREREDEERRGMLRDGFCLPYACFLPLGIVVRIQGGFMNDVTELYPRLRNCNLSPFGTINILTYCCP